ncbi:hypothetical protein K466DRAFT_544152 [Polyporus arcularius HHB13444]|uniref:F-box domain-containing protein n=1 Tax=Polyporus arcularius HHB13444 TaxID=1314778 RepID=A0A5C3PL09_9APHY|nr:hypothetical protein K466DRAFT_544152 [Polyporus arcularius HHB13444]
MQSPNIPGSLFSENDDCSRRLDPEDKMALTRLRDPALVRAWYLARSDEYAARIRALASIYNAAVPINLLPPEVLMMVFSYLSLRIRTFVRYLLVCRTWTALILRTHPFWVNLLRNAIGLDILGNKASRAQYGSFLSRTGALSVKLSTDGYVAELAPLLAGHARRIACWNSCLYTPEEVVSLSELLAGGLPTLQKLIVRDAYDDPFCRFRGDVQEDQLPSFLLFSHPFDPHAFAHLRFLCLPWNLFAPSSTLSALAVLKLKDSFKGVPEANVPMAHKLRTGTVLLTLSRCPNLVRLHYHDRPRHNSA